MKVLDGKTISIYSNVQLNVINSNTGTVERKFCGHNKITSRGIEVLTDYISGYFSISKDYASNHEESVRIINTWLENVPSYIEIGTSSTPENYTDIGVINPIIDPITKNKITFAISSGPSSTIQTTASGSLSEETSYGDGKTVSFAALSKSTTFTNFPSGTNSEILNSDGEMIELSELALMSSNGKCWARICLGDKKMILNKRRVYDIIWNVTLTSLSTQNIIIG